MPRDRLDNPSLRVHPKGVGSTFPFHIATSDPQLALYISPFHPISTLS